MDSPREMVELANEKIHPKAGTVLVWTVYAGLVSGGLLAFGALFEAVRVRVLIPAVGLIPAVDNSFAWTTALTTFGAALLSWGVVQLVFNRVRPIVQEAAGWGETLAAALHAHEKRIVALESHTDIHGLAKQLTEQQLRASTDQPRIVRDSLERQLREDNEREQG